MSGTGYEVDLAYLQATVGKLQAVASGMDGACGSVNYKTNLTRKQFGGDAFGEAQTLYAAHDTMRTAILEMITTLQTMIQEFTDKTNTVHATYSAQETTTAGHFGGAV
jgi:hypothetical protein